MKRRLNKFFSILLVICMILSMIPPIPVQAATATTLVLKVNSEWTSDSARFAAYFYVNDSTYKWVSMTSEGNNIYSCAVPSGYGNVIFCRMNGGNTTNSWDNKWNQTADLTVPDASSCMYSLYSGWWDGDMGTWGACSHSWNSGTQTTAPTCTATGVKTYTCNYCNGTKTESIAATGHSYAAATCTVAKKCTKCGATTGSALGHSYTYAKNVSPTTSSTGSIKGTCSRCGGTTTVTLPALTTTNYTRTVTKAATCTATGTYTWTWKTTTYGTFSYTSSIAATGHSYGSATCTSAATCTKCGATTGSALGHSYTYAKNVSPTTSSTGSIKGTCSRCGGTTTVTLPALTTTNYTRTVTKAATCTATGTYTWTWKTTTYGTFSYTTSIAATGHSYGSATCTSAATCANCGATTGSALGHSYTYKVTKAPTTSASGTLTGTCSRCSGTTTITIGMLGTTYHTYKVVTAATCTAAGTGRYTWKTTTYGTYYWDVSIAATGHSYTSKVTTAATCTTDGVRTYTCSSCSDSYTESIAAIGHSYSGGKCSNCGNVKSVSIAGSFNDWSTSSMSWSSSGYTFSVTLAAGTHEFKIVKEDAWLGNYGTIEDTTTATSDVGWEFVDGADNCKLYATGGTYYFTFNFDTNMLIITYTHSHSYTAGTVTAPTCTAKGYTTYTCACGDSYQGAETAATGHSWSSSTGKCTTCGTSCSHSWSNGKCSTCGLSCSHSWSSGKCSVCGLGCSHSWNSGTVTTAATCTTAGVKTYTCSTCKSTKTETIAALGHSYTSKVTAPTCTAQGYTTYTCSTCSNSYKDKYTAATGHSYTSKVTTAATCTTAGVKTYTCSNCSASYTEEIAALGHSYTSKVTAPTCTAQGYTTHTCSRCSDSYKDTYTDATGHSYSGTTCSGCGDVRDFYLWGYINGSDLENYDFKFTGNKYTLTTTTDCYVAVLSDSGDWYMTSGYPGDYVSSTTLYNTNQGISDANKLFVPNGTTVVFTLTVNTNETLKLSYTISSCSHLRHGTDGKCLACGASVSHSWSDGTCSHCGLVCSHSWSSGKCSVCGISCTHSWNGGSVTTAATCTTAGVKTYTCSTCKSTKTESIAATGHSYTSKVTAPTCTAQGYTTHTCSSCGDSYKDTYTDATGHSWNSGSVTTAATCTADGVKTYTCSACKTTKTESIAATGHSYSSKVTAPTCTADGYTTYTCSTCGYSYTGNATSATGHSYTSKVTTAATCTTAGVKTYTCSKCGGSYTEEIAATGHSYSSKVTAPTCTAGGYTTYTCSTCGGSYTGDETAATGHDHVAGTCTVCGDKLDFYLFGFINGGDYACEEDSSNLGSYKFENGKLIATFESDSYVAVKTSDNNHWYMFQA